METVVMGVFRSKATLELDRLKVAVVGRAAEAERLRTILSGVESGFLPKVIGIHGPPGSGKTLVARKVCSEYEVTSGDRFRFVYVNLGETKTVFSCANRLLTAVGGDWRAGKVGLDGVMEEFWKKILDWRGASKRIMLVGLDEADRLFMDPRGDPSGFLYRLVRSQDRLADSGLSLSLLTISNAPIGEIWELDGRVRSSMGVEEIFFRPYGREELRGILLGRCAEAFNPGVVDEQVLEACVEHVAVQSRDVRRMLDLLRVCGEMAEAQGEVRVETKHFAKATERFDQDHYKGLFGSLAETQMNLLFILSRLYEVEEVTSASTNQVYQRYKELSGAKAASYRRVASILKEMEVMNLIGVRNVSKGRGGRSGEVWLKVPAESVFEYKSIDLRELKKKTTELKEIKKEIERIRASRRRGLKAPRLF